MAIARPKSYHNDCDAMQCYAMQEHFLLTNGWLLY
jgi:hypothetical protein